MGGVAAAHAASSRLVTIAGADADAYAGPYPGSPVPWDDAIQPLDQGTHDLLPFLGALDAAGYDGPVVLHTFGITNSPGHLRRSLEAYDKLLANLP